jgi:hypothetical protein
MAIRVSAAEYPGNPDRFPSIGLNFAGSAETGDATTFGGGASAKQDLKVSNGALILDLRLPVSNNVTITGGVASIATKIDASETTVLFGSKSDTSGASFNLGVRFYIH